MLQRVFLSWTLPLWMSFVLLGAVPTSSNAQEQLEITPHELPISDEEMLGLPDDVSIVGWFTLKPDPASPLKNEHVKGYVLSNGQKGYFHHKRGHVRDLKPREVRGIDLKIDYKTNTYYARPLTASETQEIRNSLDYQAETQ